MLYITAITIHRGTWLLKRLNNESYEGPIRCIVREADRNIIKLIDFLNRIRLFPLFGKGENLMQPVHARDLGNVYCDVLMNPNVTMNNNYNFSGKNPLTYKKLFETVSKKLNEKTALVSLPLGLSFFSARIYNKLTSKALISEEQVLRMQEDKAFSYEKAKKDFGYNPVDFEEDIQEVVETYLKSKGQS